MSSTPEDLRQKMEEKLEEFKRELAEERRQVVTESAAASAYTLADLERETAVPQAELSRWLRAIERKKHAILYGPPGTGKTYIAKRLARLLKGSDGYQDLVQFHPAYTYEDFIEGIRPQENDEGQLELKMVPGRFRTFCAYAERFSGLAVLVIDEINRANLSRVFGELMYLLEYREEKIHLAGAGVLGIPANVRLIGTMNTADRSIALVDHALRRRFAFIELAPRYEILAQYHASHNPGLEVGGLIAVLKRLNSQIERDYQVGITFFLRPSLADDIADIWEMEIIPYLEEYFFDQRHSVEPFRWSQIRDEVNLC
jgi:5-methylcytosine-specific restriction enzyme B